jgi:hypothetical protein
MSANGVNSFFIFANLHISIQKPKEPKGNLVFKTDFNFIGYDKTILDIFYLSEAFVFAADFNSVFLRFSKMYL